MGGKRAWLGPRKVAFSRDFTQEEAEFIKADGVDVEGMARSAFDAELGNRLANWRAGALERQLAEAQREAEEMQDLANEAQEKADELAQALKELGDTGTEDTGTEEVELADGEPTNYPPEAMPLG